MSIKYLILSYFAYFRMISNYELNDGDFIRLSSTLKQAGSSDFNEALVAVVRGT